ncbi:MAG: 4-(cytidine 5'-diphospho)-2-C-methyl-D-erythritol kinase [Actinomycetota bacterium]|nr:4-(cytidine 5'-diphospho)-2-C-methyl-D-erythritol kinase [Actinomycetota bacterium]
MPAKINLSLGVGPVREDGFHDARTVYQAVSLYDDVIATPGSGFSVTATGDGASTLPSGDGNLAVRAARALAQHTGVDSGVSLALIKGIPVAGGMAGGSADAAGALVGCDALWQTACDRSTLATLAAELGSDVPFSLHGGTALGTGRGDQLTPVLSQGTYHWVLALAAGTLATPAVYAELDRLRAAGKVGDDPADPAPVLAALRAGDPAALGKALRNDLQPAALSLRPQLRRVLDAAEDLGALGALVSGSGPTCAFLVRNETESVRVAAALPGLGLCRTVRRASGPVSGPRLLGPDGI